MSSKQQHTPVLVVGAGLAGLSVALFLAQHEVPSLVVERHRGMSPHPRARGINPRAMELMRSAGIESRVRATASARALAENSGVYAGQSLTGHQMGALHEAYFMDVKTDLSSLSPTGWCLCHQDEFEPVIHERAQELGADFLYGTELVSFKQEDEERGITAVLRDRDSGETRTVHADYLVAADGPTSALRTQLGIGFDGPGTTGNFLNVHFEADLAEELGERRFIMMYTFNDTVRGALMPLDNARRWLLHVTFDPTAQDPASFTDERCQELVRAAAGVPELAVKVLGAKPWEAAGRSASAYRSGRVFLIGDAAHVMPPSGAFGSNTGVQDAHNLAWKLAMVLRGEAGPGLLDSYDAERRPIGASIVEQAVLRSKDRPRLADKEPAPANPDIVADTAIWFGGQYRSGAVLAGPQEPALPDGVWNPAPGGAPGTRAPHVALERQGQPLSTLDLFSRSMVLLTGPEAENWAAAGQAAAQRLGITLGVVRIGSPEGPSDPSGQWPGTFGVTARGAVLVRPDGVVAWRAPAGHETPDAVLAHALAAVLSR
ncbi:FAD-dependent monooxygenase [Streptomyces sp. NPDC050147]|uniref:FAD-dependent oxidoreductase n=1 Tax=Streptomyces sp. NPDC050147 TaxID=3155513 RepID=UPI00342BBF4E